jgi:hypothetical protein
MAGAALWCAFVLPATTGDAYPFGDGALIELYTLHASQGLWGLGPYSRFGWHHPGPLYFYLCVPFYDLSREHGLALNAAAFAINIAALGVIAWCAVRYAGRAFVLSLLVAFGVLLWRVPALMVSAWNPHVIVLPCAALIVMAAVVASGRLSLLPALVFTGSFLVQTHIALVPCTLAIAGAALIAALWGQWRERAAWRWIAAAAVTGAIVWIPPIVEQLTTADGNLSQLARFFLTPDERFGGITWNTALQVLAFAWTAPFGPRLRLPHGQDLTVDASLVSIGLVITAIVALVMAGRWAAVRGMRVEAWTCRLSALMSIAAFLSIARIRGGLHEHVVWWVAIVGVISVAALAAVLITFLASRFDTAATGAPIAAAGAPAPPRRFPVVSAVPAAAIVMLTIAAASGAARLDRLRLALPIKDPAAGGGSPTEMAFRCTRGFVARTRAQRPLLRVAGTWAETAGLVLQFHKRGYTIRVDPGAVWLYGPMFAPRGDEDLELTVANRDTRDDVGQQPDDCMLLERHGLSIHVRQSSLARDISVVCE